MEFSPRAIGVAWFDRETWDALWPQFEDKDMVPKAYEDWLKTAEYGFKKAQRIYPCEIVKIHVDINDFLAFFTARNRKIDSEGRSEFAAFYLARKDAGN